MRFVFLALLGLLSLWSPSVQAQTPVAMYCYQGPTNPQWSPCSASNQLQVSASVTASVTGFAPNGNYASITSAGTSGSVALPAGTVVVFSNTGTTTVSCTLGIGSAIAVAGEIQIPASSSVAFTVGSNTFGACIDQTGSTSNTVVLAGGTGLFTGFGGGGGGGGSGGSVTQGTTPWVDSITIWGGGTLGAMANYGTSPGAVLVPGVNASVTGSVLPTGAATSALQTTGNSTLTTINTTLGSPFQAGGSIGNTSFAATQGTSPWVVSNGGTFAVQATLQASAATAIGKVDPNTIATWGLAATSQNVSAPTNGMVVLGQFTTTPTTLSTTNVSPLQMDNAGNLLVNIKAGAAAGGTSSSFAAAFPSTGTAIGMSQGGNMVALTGTSNNLNVQCANCSGSGVSTADEAVFTAGTSLFAGTGGFFQTTATNNALTNGQQGMFQVTANRALFSNLRNAAGTEVGTAGAPLQVSVANTAANGTPIVVNGGLAQASTTSGQSGVLDQCAVTTSAPTYTTAQTDPLSCDTAGNLRVNVVTATGLAAGSTTSGQTGSLIMGAVTSATPSYTTAQTNYSSLTTDGGTRVAPTAPAVTTIQSAAVANGNGTNLNMQGYTSAALNVLCSVACSGGTTINFEASVDNTTFVPIQGINVGTNTIATTTTTSGDWLFNASGYSFLRARISAYSAGTISIKAYQISAAALPPVVNANIVANTATNQSVNVAQVNGTTTLTGTGAVGAGAQRVAVGTDTATIAGSAPGTAGSASANVVTVQGIASMTKLLVTPDSVALPANQSVNVSQFGGVSTATGQVAVSVAPVTATNTALVVDLRPDSPGIINLGPAADTSAVPEVLTPTSNSNSAMSHASVTALGNSLVVKASAGNLYGFNCSAIAGAAAGNCIAYNGSSVPGTGALTGANVLDSCNFDTTTKGCSLSRIPLPINYSTGIVILVSSAASPFTYTTGTDTAFISADYK
jgi:hypothetical protein